MELRSHSIAVNRDVAVAAVDPRTLKVETCIGTACTTGTPLADGTLQFPAAFSGPASGALTPNPDGPAKLSLTISVAEGQPETRTPVVVRVLDASGAKLHETSTEVRWNDDECHPAPESTAL